MKVKLRAFLNQYSNTAPILSNLYIYKVSNADGWVHYRIPFKRNNRTVPKSVLYDIPDYVVAAGFESQAQQANLSSGNTSAMPGLSIVPLGSGLIVNPDGLVQGSSGSPIVDF